MTEGNFPCLTIFLEGLPKMEGSPLLVSGRLGLDEVIVGVLVGSRRRCRTSKGEDALIALGKDATVVEEATSLLSMLWFCKAREHEGIGGRVHGVPCAWGPVCTEVQGPCARG